jgi:transposase
VNDLVKTKAVAEALGVSAETVRRRGEKERWLCRKTPGGVLWLAARLPEDARLALARADAEAALAERAAPEKPPEQAGLFARASKREKEIALLRAELVRLWERSGMRKEDFLEAYNAGAVNGALRASLGAASISSFYRWLADWKKAGRDIGALPPPPQAQPRQEGAGRRPLGGGEAPPHALLAQGLKAVRHGRPRPAFAEHAGVHMLLPHGAAVP